jgi:hypothetical protein
MRSVLAGAFHFQAEARTAVYRGRPAHDPQAEARALSEPVSETTLAERRAKIVAMKQHRQALKQTGHRLVNTFFAKIERVLERRVEGA